MKTLEQIAKERYELWQATVFDRIMSPTKVQ